MTSPSPQGQCCVCGAPSTQRCSACGKAGFNLFFCSQEHQKLVWYGHKLSCGMGSKETPFHLPPLTKEEGDILKRDWAVLDQGSGWERDLDYFVPGACRKMGFSGIIDAVSKPNPLPDYPPSAAAGALNLLRQAVPTIQLKTAIPPGCSTAIVPVGDPLVHQAGAAGLFSTPLLNDAEDFARQIDHRHAYPLHDPLYVDFHHRTLVDAALVGLRSIGPSFRPAQLATLPKSGFALNQMLCALERLRSTYPRQVAHLRDVLDGRKSIWDD